MWKTAIYNATEKTFLYWDANYEKQFVKNITEKSAKLIFQSNDCVAFYFEIAE